MMNRIEDIDKIRLEQLNETIKNAVNERTKFLDDCTEKYSKFKIGDDVYDLNSGTKVGTVKQIDRYHRGNAQYDTSFNYTIRFSSINGFVECINYNHGTKQDVINRHQRILNQLKKD